MCVLLHICVQYLPEVVDVFVRPVARDKTLFNLIIKFLKTLRVIKNLRVIDKKQYKYKFKETIQLVLFKIYFQSHLLNH